MAECAAIEVVPVRSDNFSFIVRHSEGVCIVDPPEIGPIQTGLAEMQPAVTAILLTHHHHDHVAAAAELARDFGCPVYGPRDPRMPMVTDVVEAGTNVPLARDLEASVFEVPGHTSSHVAFYVEPHRALFCGDLIFSGGCGRLFEGTGEQMWASIAQFDHLPDDTLVYCGHEYTESNLRFALCIEPDNAELVDYAEEVRHLRQAGQWTIPCLLGRERRINPFLRVRMKSIQDAVGLPEGPPGAVFSRLREMKDDF